MEVTQEELQAPEEEMGSRLERPGRGGWTRLLAGFGVYCWVCKLRGLKKQDADRNELDWRMLAGREKGEDWQLPKEMETWGGLARRGFFRTFHSQIHFVISSL